MGRLQKVISEFTGTSCYYTASTVVETIRYKAYSYTSLDSCGYCPRIYYWKLANLKKSQPKVFALDVDDNVRRMRLESLAD
jgi:hypothetical protein